MNSQKMYADKRNSISSSYKQNSTNNLNVQMDIVETDRGQYDYQN